MATGGKLGEILVKQGLISPDQMLKALEEHKKNGQRISLILIQQGGIKDLQILKTLENYYQISGIDLNTFPIQENVVTLLSKDFCEKNLCIPVQRAGPNLVVAMCDPTNIFVKDDLMTLTRLKIQPILATELAIATAIDRYFKDSVQNMGQVISSSKDEDEDELFGLEAGGDGNVGEEGPIIKFVNSVITEAIKKKASDIHFETYEKKFRVRFRIDGNLVETASQQTAAAPAVVSRIKIMAKLDIAEKRRPQDGRIKLRYQGGKDMDFRVSVLPTIWGEKVVMRLLDKSNLQLDMTKLGFEQEDLDIFKEAIHQPQGLVLLTGPTGSGKTTTIYSALADLNQPDVNISTAEDPVEFNLEGINQVQMNSDIDLNFASALRSFLRQDPDIIMVGEIRDLETAEIAIKAASTGHLVVSTLHTNDAPQTVSRLTEMGVAPYIVTSTVTLIVAQRLVGKICESCKIPFQVDANTLLNLGADVKDIPEYKIYKGNGCGNCNGTGIKGRIAIYELLRMTEKVKEAILSGVSSSELRIIAKEEGTRTLRRSALLKLKRGQTTIEEVVNASVKDTL